MEKNELDELKGNVKTTFNSCFCLSTNFYQLIDNAEKKSEIISALKWYRDEIYEFLGGEVVDEYEYQREIDDLNYTIDELKEENEDLRHNLYHFSNSLDDHYKVLYFNQYRDLYTPWELEKLLQKGKEFLKNANISNQ